jgi:DNA repair exonuclease SbcCD nuclease subunit
VLRILHTADWQLGKEFNQFSQQERSRLTQARFEIPNTLRQLCVKHQVDAMLVAGDVFDSQDIDDGHLQRVMHALSEFPCPVVLLPGNHDADIPKGVFARAELWLAGQPSSPVKLARSFDPIMLCNGRLMILPAPLKHRHEQRIRFEQWPDALEHSSTVRIGLAHGSVRGILPPEFISANEIDLDALKTKGLDYLALGDWHGCLKVNERSYYSGTPEPDRFRANDSGQALLVSFQDDCHLQSVERLMVASLRWRELDQQLQSLALSGTTDMSLAVSGTTDMSLAVSGTAKVSQMLEANLAPWDQFSFDDVLKIKITGAINQSEAQALELRIQNLRARVAALDCDQSGLTSALSEAEINALLDGIDDGSGILLSIGKQLQQDCISAPTDVAAQTALKVWAELVSKLP